MPLVFWLDAVPCIMTLFVTVVAYDFGDIPLVRAILTFLFLGYLSLVCFLTVGLGNVRVIGRIGPKNLGSILSCSETSLFCFYLP